MSKNSESPQESVASTDHLHVVFMVDTTASMGTYLTALKRALCQVCSLLHVLYPDSADLSVICYEDYGDGKRLLRSMIQKPFPELYSFVSGLIPGGGGDIAEASKTALIHLSKLIRNWKEDTTIVFYYTDAPPHHKLTNPDGSNRPKEDRALKDEKLDQIGVQFRGVSVRSLTESRFLLLFQRTLQPPIVVQHSMSYWENSSSCPQSQPQQSPRLPCPYCCSSLVRQMNPLFSVLLSNTMIL